MALTQKLKAKELAEKFGVSTRTIINWATKGPDRLPGSQINGHTWSFDEEQAQQWWERQQSISEIKTEELLNKFNLRKD